MSRPSFPNSQSGRLDERKKIAEIINLWIQTVAIIAAGGWGFYTFVYKEISVPRSEIGHVSGKAELRIVAVKEPYRAIQASIYIKNNSKKTVRLLAGLVEVVGYRFTGNIQRGSLENVPWRPLQGEPRPIITSFDAARETRVLMASDPIRDIDLGSGEERIDTVIFHVDSRCCDYMDLFVYTPLTYNDLELEAEWEIVGGDAVHALYRRDHGERRQLNDDEERQLLKNQAFDILRLRHSLSLWPEWGRQEIAAGVNRNDSSGASLGGSLPSKEVINEKESRNGGAVSHN